MHIARSVVITGRKAKITSSTTDAVQNFTEWSIEENTPAALLHVIYTMLKSNELKLTSGANLALRYAWLMADGNFDDFLKAFQKRDVRGKFTVKTQNQMFFMRRMSKSPFKVSSTPLKIITSLKEAEIIKHEMNGSIHIVTGSGISEEVFLDDDTFLTAEGVVKTPPTKLFASYSNFYKERYKTPFGINTLPPKKAEDKKTNYCIRRRCWFI